MEWNELSENARSHGILLTYSPSLEMQACAVMPLCKP